MLQKSVYAGYVSAPVWGIPIREGQHEGLISKATYARIQQRLKEGVYAATRKDIAEDFRLRGAVCCASCSTPLTGGWSKGKYKKYAYYFCREKGCELYGKTIAKKKIEGAFRKLLGEMRPSEKHLELARAMFKDAWDQKAAQVHEDAAMLATQVQDIDQQIGKYAEKAVEASSSHVLSAYEKRINELESQKLIIAEKSQNLGQNRYGFDELFELCARFLSSPCKIWDSGRFEMQRLVLRLGFSEHLFYCRENGFRAPKTTLPFKALGAFSGGLEMDGAAGEN